MAKRRKRSVPFTFLDMNSKNLFALLAAIALTAAITYVALPFLMTVPVVAHAVDAYVLKPQNPAVTGIVLGLAFALIGSLTYTLYALFKPSTRTPDQMELPQEP